MFSPATARDAEADRERVRLAQEAYAQTPEGRALQVELAFEKWGPVLAGAALLWFLTRR